MSLDEVTAALDHLVSLLGRLDPALVTGADCADLTSRFTTARRALDAARLATALRAADCRAFPGASGSVDAADWLARVEGCTRRQAIEMLRLGDRLDTMPRTRAALADGEVSVGQAQVITATEDDAKGSEPAMLDVARSSDFASLREESRRLRQAAIPPEELDRRRRKARYHRRWVNELGMACGSYALMPGDGTGFHEVLEAETNRRVRAEKVATNRARREGRVVERQTREQHEADALLAMIEQGGRGRAVRREVVIVADVRTLEAGDDSVGGGCHVIGAGPVPVTSVLSTLSSGDAFIKGVVHDGVDVLSVRHFGRKIPAELRTAVMVGRPPLFDGLRCATPGCGRRHGIEIDHIVPVAAGGETSYRNLQGQCTGDHLAKTEADRAAGLLTPASAGSDRGDAAGRAPP